MRITKKAIAVILTVLMAISMMPFTAFAAVQCPECGSTDVEQIYGSQYKCNDCSEWFDYTPSGPPCPECGSTNTQQMSGNYYYCENCYENFEYTDPSDTVEGDGSEYNPYMVGSYTALVSLCNSFRDEWYEDYAPYVQLKADIEFNNFILTLGYGINLNLDTYHIDSGVMQTRFEGDNFTITGGTGSYISKAYIQDGATVNLNSGTLEEVTVDNCELVINGGSITEDFETDNHAVVEMNNGTACEIDMDDTSEFTMTGGTVNNFIHLNDQSTSIISGGTIPGLTLYGSATCAVSGGTFTAGSTVVNGGTLTVSGGDFSGQYGGILNYGGAVEVTGGTFGSVTNTSGTMALKGGNYEKRPTYYDIDEQTYLETYVPNGYNVEETANYFTVVSVPVHTIIWQNWDGTILETDAEVEEGETPTYDGETPTKAEDAQYTYEFAGWSPEVTAVTGDVTYTATFVDVLSISNVDEWNSFAASVKDGNTYSGKIVRMTADVGPVTTMVGGTFSGTFDGGSHTLTVNISGGNASVATFEVVKDATIQNLTLAGSITSSGIHSAALVKSISGSGTSCTIKNVDIYADVNCSNNYLGGFIGHAGTANTVNIENSAYLGAINKTGNAEGNFIGGFIGWSQTCTATINNCAFTGSYSNIKSFNNIGFSYNAPTSVTVNDFYSNATEVFVANVNHGTRLYVPDSGYTTAVALVKHGGEKTFFNQLSDALNAWVDGSTLMLMSDVTTASTISVGGTKTLDLNGYKLRISKNLQVISVQEGGDLTIKSSAQGGEVIGCNADRAVVGGTGQTLTLESGTIKTAASNCISGTNAVFNLNGGAIEGTSNSSDMTVASAVYCKGNCTVNWNGTSITTNTGCGFYSNKTTDTVKIGGGSFAATADTLPDNAGYVLSNCNVEIQGAPVLNGKGIYLSNGRVINVTGELTNDVPIGVVMQTPGVFTSGLQGNGGIANFANGNGDDYGIGLDASGEAQVVRKYTVTWKLDETTVLATDKVLEGTVPTFTGTAPADYEDAEYTYTFAGWTPEVTAVTGEATYTATYTATPKVVSHLLTLLVGENGSVEGGFGTYGNATSTGNVYDLSLPLTINNQCLINVADGQTINVVEGGSISVKSGGQFSFYPSATNTGVFTAVPAEGYVFDGWYNGETLYSENAVLDYQNISEALTLTAQFVPAEPNNGASITVAETISENFYLDDEFYGEDSFIAVNYNHNSNVSEADDFRTDVVAMNSLPELDDSTSEYNGARKYSVVQAPAQATETITINVYPTQADAEAGTNAIGEPIEYSVYSYCRQIITGDYAENLKDLARATLDYAAAAQDYFDYNTEKMATKDATGGFYNNVAGADLSSVAGVSAAPSCIAKASVVVKSDLEINLFSLTPIEVTGASMDATKGKDRFAATSYQSGDYYVVHIVGIEPANMDNTITVNTSEGNIVMTANAIIKMMLNSNDAKLVTLAKAMYLYGAAANTYFD